MGLAWLVSIAWADVAPPQPEPGGCCQSSHVPSGASSERTLSGAVVLGAAALVARARRRR